MHALRRLARENSSTTTGAGIHVKGFEDPVLRKAVGTALEDLADVVDWVHMTWSGLGLKDLDRGGEPGGDERKAKSPSTSRS